MIADQKIKVFHLEDYKIMRDGMRALLSGDDEIELVGEAPRGEDLLKALESVKVDVLLLDIYLDEMENINTMDGFEICTIVKDKYPEIRVLAHSVYDDADRVARIFKAGAIGFVSKKSGFDELIQAIKLVSHGEKILCNEVSGKLKNLNQFLSGIEDTLKGKEEIFSSRERKVLELLSQGMSSKEIASILYITERTVESHRKNMIGKGQVKNTVELISFAYAKGLLKK